MIVRIARFNDLPADGREWITDALAGVPGIRSCYHATAPDGQGYISVSIGDDHAAFTAAERALTERRIELGIEGQGPDEITVYEVAHYVENI